MTRRENATLPSDWFVPLNLLFQAIQDGQAQVAGEDDLNRELQANIWEPAYVPYERCGTRKG